MYPTTGLALTSANAEKEATPKTSTWRDVRVKSAGTEPERHFQTRAQGGKAQGKGRRSARPTALRTATEPRREGATLVWPGRAQTPRGCRGLFPDLDGGYTAVVFINSG